MYDFEILKKINDKINVISEYFFLKFSLNLDLILE